MVTLRRNTLIVLLSSGCTLAFPGFALAQQAVPVQGGTHATTVQKVAEGDAAANGDSPASPQVTQDQQDTQAQTKENAKTLKEVIVSAAATYRKHIDVPAPILTYDKKFFNKFEPVTVGDQLRRVPDVSFVGDIGESVQPEMRGLGHGYTQVLVNGRRVPGITNDRAVAVDRIPAAIVDHIEVIRSPTADIDSNGIGGTLNIVLKSGASLPPGAIVRVGEVYHKKSGNFRPNAEFTWSGRNDAKTLFYSMTVEAQKRFNEKHEVQGVFDENSAGFADEVAAGGWGRSLESWDDRSQSTATEREVQGDSRDSRDLSFNGSLSWNIAKNSTLRFDARVLNTQRDEIEDTRTYEGDGSPGGFTKIKRKFEDTPIHKHTGGVGVTLYQGFGENTYLEAHVGYTSINGKTVKNKFKKSWDNLDKIESSSATDKDWYGDFAITQQMPGLAHTFGINRVELKFGVQASHKNRHFDQFETKVSKAKTTDGHFDYKSKRADGYGRMNFYINSVLTVTGGVRWENTWTKQEFTNEVVKDGAVSDSVSGAADRHVSMVNPTAHLRWRLSDNSSLRFSVARTVRRPSFNELVPSITVESPEDEDVTVGNPDLKMERALGFDLGYEHTLGQRGVFGVNVFTRRISNLIGLVRTNRPVTDLGEDPEDYPGGVYSYANLGDAKVRGIEFDLSTPLYFLGMKNTGLFANYSRLFSKRHSPIKDEDIEISDQPSYVYNVGITQTIPSWAFSFGAFYNRQGMSKFVTIGEMESTKFDGNLEFFIEKDFGDSFVLRLTGKNLLDACSYQMEPNFAGDSGEAIVANQAAFNVDHYEVERECSSPTWSLTFRAVF